MMESIVLILANNEAKYFLVRGWTGICGDCPSGKSARADSGQQSAFNTSILNGRHEQCRGCRRARSITIFAAG
jgi:hypothetical protein